MSQLICYGQNSSFQMDIAPDNLVADCRTMLAHPRDDPASAVYAALSNPVGYPPLHETVLPGDRVVIALQPEVPQPARVVSGVVQVLLESEVDTVNIAILYGGNQSSEDSKLVTAIRESVAEGIDVVVHDPNDQNELAYLAASKQANPIYLNRRICDADVLIPIGFLRGRASLGYTGIHSGLLPTFSDQKTQRRFHAPASALQPARLTRCRAEANEAAWLLGVQFTVQVIPGPGDTILHVLAGQMDEVARQGDSLCDTAWSFAMPKNADLVIAPIEGGDDQQTWENFGRALYAASRVCEESGTIVLCTDMHCRPGPALQKLANGLDDDRLERQILRARSPDAVSAALLLKVRSHHHVFLLSRLDQQLVEGLGLGYVPDAADIQRLSRQHDACILLTHAHRATPRVSPAG